MKSLLSSLSGLISGRSVTGTGYFALPLAARTGNPLVQLEGFNLLGQPYPHAQGFDVAGGQPPEVAHTLSSRTGLRCAAGA